MTDQEIAQAVRDLYLAKSMLWNHNINEPCYRNNVPVHVEWQKERNAIQELIDDANIRLQPLRDEMEAVVRGLMQTKLTTETWGHKMYNDHEVAAYEPQFCYDCGEEVTSDNDSGLLADFYDTPICIACTTECRGCGETVRLIEMAPLYDYDSRDYCPACHERWQECEDKARDELMEQLVELTQEKFEHGSVF